MTEKFTPGEWVVSTEEDDCFIVRDKNGGFVCYGGCFDPDNKSEVEYAKKDITLIAASPEMYRNNEQTLTELEQMIPAMLSICADCYHRNCKVCQFAKVLKTASEMERRIENVQKKARGEE